MKIKIIIDEDNKTLTLSGTKTNMGELFDFISKLFPDNWREFSIKGEENTNINITYHLTDWRHSRESPYYPPFYITC